MLQAGAKHNSWMDFFFFFQIFQFKMYLLLFSSSYAANVSPQLTKLDFCCVCAVWAFYMFLEQLSDS